MSRLFLLVTLVSLACSSANAREITINGAVQSHELTPTLNNIYIFQFGAPYYTNQPEVNWTLLGETRSDSNGIYSITLEIGRNTEVAIVVPYAYPRYSLIKRLEVGVQNTIGDVLLTLPNPKNPEIAYQARVFTNGVELDYKNRIYDIVIVPLDFTDQGIWVQLSDGIYPRTENKVFNAQDGKYRAHCLLASPGLGTGAITTTVQFSLPLKSGLLDCNF